MGVHKLTHVGVPLIVCVTVGVLTSVHCLCMEFIYLETTNLWVHVSDLSDVNLCLTSGLAPRLKSHSNFAAPLKLLVGDSFHYFSSL